MEGRALVSDTSEIFGAFLDSSSWKYLTEFNKGVNVVEAHGEASLLHVVDHPRAADVVKHFLRERGGEVTGHQPWPEKGGGHVISGEVKVKGLIGP